MTAERKMSVHRIVQLANKQRPKAQCWSSEDLVAAMKVGVKPQEATGLGSALRTLP